MRSTTPLTASAPRWLKMRGYGRQKTKRTYTVVVQGSKITVEVVNRKSSYVATAMSCARRLHHLPGQCN
ncbi:DUF4060 family protein [Klebsiella variicola]|uniref:DUF4060 family protein n=1 Tax=Klebsiella variicola TaxID=244366 RepID=UPI002166720B|nr:DUF4060 family protein [Klebsiella variicola]